MKAIKVNFFSGKSNKKGLIKGSSFEDTDYIITGNYANKHLNYYYYVPSSVTYDLEFVYPLIICVPGLSGMGKWFIKNSIKDFAHSEKFVILAPSFKFDDKYWEIAKSYQYPAVWSGEALLKIIQKINKTGIYTSDLYLLGFSAGAQFVLRLSLWQSDLCKAVSAHAFGGRIIPDKYVNVKYFVSCGIEDTYRKEHAEAFFMSAGPLGIHVTYKQYQGGHFLPDEQISDTLSFFQEVKND